MKLYTEEQVRVAMSLSFIKDTIATENQIIDSLKFIKLPSYEEIDKHISYLNGILFKSGVRTGAELVITLIKQQADGESNI